MAESNFKKLQQKMERKEGYSPKVAAAAAAVAGRNALGEKEMARRAAAGRKKKS